MEQNLVVGYLANNPINFMDKNKESDSIERSDESRKTRNT